MRKCYARCVGDPEQRYAIVAGCCELQRICVIDRIRCIGLYIFDDLILNSEFYVVIIAYISIRYIDLTQPVCSVSKSGYSLNFSG